MERIIKFRGIDTTTCKWVYGYYVHLKNKSHECHCIMTNRDVNLNNPRLVTIHDVLFTVINPETVGQFTGLLDKNGKEIYEGDIFRLNDHHIRYVVEYEEGVFHGKQIGSSSYVGLPYWLPDIVILGNKYDNPELMKR